MSTGAAALLVWYSKVIVHKCTLEAGPPTAILLNHITTTNLEVSRLYTEWTTHVCS